MASRRIGATLRPVRRVGVCSGPRAVVRARRRRRRSAERARGPRSRQGLRRPRAAADRVRAPADARLAARRRRAPRAWTGSRARWAISATSRGCGWSTRSRRRRRRRRSARSPRRSDVAHVEEDAKVVAVRRHRAGAFGVTRAREDIPGLDGEGLVAAVDRLRDRHHDARPPAGEGDRLQGPGQRARRRRTTTSATARSCRACWPGSGAGGAEGRGVAPARQARRREGHRPERAEQPRPDRPGHPVGGREPRARTGSTR